MPLGFGEGAALLRYAHRTVAPAEGWARMRAECEAHTEFYLHNLAEYLRWFAGREARYIGIETGATADATRARLGLPAGATVGDRIALAAPAGASIEGEVDYLTPSFLGIRGEQLLFRVYGRDAWDDPSTVALHLSTRQRTRRRPSASGQNG